MQSISDLFVELQNPLKPYLTKHQPNQLKNLQSPKKHDNAIKRSGAGLLNHLTNKPTPVDALSAKTGLSLQQLNAQLL